MNMKQNSIGETAGIQLPVCEKLVTTEVAGDFSLPDYQPEIKRLLRVNVSALPPTRYAGNGSVDLAGTLDYFATYVGEDGKLYCAPLSSDYRITVPAEGDAEAGTTGVELTVCTCDLFPESVTGRVTAPRRLNLRCRLRAKVKVYGEKPLGGTDEGGLTPGSMEKLTGEAPVCRLFRRTGELLELQDDVILSPQENDLRVICAEGQALVTDTTAGSGMVNCRGEITLKLTVCHDGGEGVEGSLPTIMVRKLPFSQAVEVEGVTPGCDCCAHGVCPELSVEVNEGQIHVDLGLVLEVLAQRNDRVRYTKDLYSTRSETVCTYAAYRPEKAMRVLHGNFTLSDSLPLEEAGVDPAARVVGVTAQAEAETLTVGKGRCLLTGTCRALLLLFKDGEYSVAPLSLPFRYETDAPTDAASDNESQGEGAAVFDGRVTVVTCRARMDGQRLGLDAELGVSVRVVTPQVLTALSGVTPGAGFPDVRGETVICFPASGDTLWSVAKRYHASLAELAAANSLPADADGGLEGVGYVII